MFVLAVNHQVEDYERWKQVFDEFPPGEGGAVFHPVNRLVDSPNTITVVAGSQTPTSPPRCRERESPASRGSSCTKRSRWSSTRPCPLTGAGAPRESAEGLTAPAVIVSSQQERRAFTLGRPVRRGPEGGVMQRSPGTARSGGRSSRWNI